MLKKIELKQTTIIYKSGMEKGPDRRGKNKSNKNSTKERMGGEKNQHRTGRRQSKHQLRRET